MSDQRLSAITTAIIERLGTDTTDLQRDDARRLAELRLLCERQRARALAGRRIDLLKLCRMEGLANRLARTLGVDKPPERKARPAMARAAEEG